MSHLSSTVSEQSGVAAETEADQRPQRIAVQTRYRADRDAELMAAYEASSSPSDGGPAIVISFSLGTDHENLIQA
jgi:hypothetical protein